MNLRFSPHVASAIVDRSAGQPLWQIDIAELLAKTTGSDDTWDGGTPVETEREYPLTEFIGTYLSALFLANPSHDLVEFGSSVVRRYAAAGDVNSLVLLTNYIFKRLTLSPPVVSDHECYRRCIEVNFKLHVAANLAIHSIRSSSSDYYNFAREINQLIERISNDKFPKRFCFVFLTESYLDNFDLWIETFARSTRGREHLVIVCIGPSVQGRIQQKLNAIEFNNATIYEFLPSRELPVCGNGENLYYLWYLKIRMVRHFILNGHDLIYSDLDSFRLKDFIPVWEGPGLSDLDILFMPSGDMPLHAVQQWSVIPCCGFFACRASERLQSFLGMWERWVEVMFDDQIGLAQMLLDAGVQWEERSDSPDWRRIVFDPRLVADPPIDPEIKFGLLNPALAKRAGAPDLAEAQRLVIWHPRWIASKEEHFKIAAALESLAGAAAGNPPIQEQETLTALANRYGSDKGTTAGSAHHYTFLYDLLFGDARNSAINLLEIGLAVGGPELGNSAERIVTSPSVQMWLSYFTQAKIYGFDITDFSHMQHPRFQFVQGDCGRAEDLQEILRVSPQFDIIIDDASHASYHQQNSFKVLFPSLRPGGLYIIEDLHWQSPFFEDVLPSVPKTWEFFQEFFVNDKYRDNQLVSKGFMDKTKAETHSFAYFRDFTGQTTTPKIMVIRKKGTPAWVKAY